MNWKELINRAGLNRYEIEKLERIEENLPLIADLVGADLFIDCIQKKDGRMFVASQAGPGYMKSAYQGSVIGCYAEREDEAAVYRAVETKVPVRDIKAVTQEDKSVRQDVVPITNESGKVIAALISERDISKDIRQEKKYEELVKQIGTRQTLYASPEDVARREVHHRVKNHLQLIASMMNIQARKAENEEVRLAFQENTARVLNIASINELLTYSDTEVSLKEFLEKLRKNLFLLYSNESPINLTLEGDELFIGQEQATDIALVINELVSNAYKHAFHNCSGGEINIILKKGEAYSSITVRDNGTGYKKDKDSQENFGMSLVKMTVKGKLGGKLYVTSDRTGTTVTFDFRVQECSGNRK